MVYLKLCSYLAMLNELGIDMKPPSQTKMEIIFSMKRNTHSAASLHGAVLPNEDLPYSPTRIITASDDARNKGPPPRRLSRCRRGGDSPQACVTDNPAS
jgi:hypothetical protein